MHGLSFALVKPVGFLAGAGGAEYEWKVNKYRLIYIWFLDVLPIKCHFILALAMNCYVAVLFFSDKAMLSL